MFRNIVKVSQWNKLNNISLVVCLGDVDFLALGG
jgi:hypothetical protein